MFQILRSSWLVLALVLCVGCVRPHGPDVPDVDSKINIKIPSSVIWEGFAKLAETGSITSTELAAAAVQMRRDGLLQDNDLNDLDNAIPNLANADRPLGRDDAQKLRSIGGKKSMKTLESNNRFALEDPQSSVLQIVNFAHDGHEGTTDKEVCAMILERIKFRINQLESVNLYSEPLKTAFDSVNTLMWALDEEDRRTLAILSGNNIQPETPTA